MSDLSAVTTGTTKEALQAIRDAIVTDLAKCESMRDKAALYLRLTSVVEQLAATEETAPEADPVDQLAARRNKRRGA